MSAIFRRSGARPTALLILAFGLRNAEGTPLLLSCSGAGFRIAVTTPVLLCSSSDGAGDLLNGESTPALRCADGVAPSTFFSSTASTAWFRLYSTDFLIFLFITISGQVSLRVLRMESCNCVVVVSAKASKASRE
jgi:hypothetical protein